MKQCWLNLFGLMEVLCVIVFVYNSNEGEIASIRLIVCCFRYFFLVFITCFLPICFFVVFV